MLVPNTMSVLLLAPPGPTPCSFTLPCSKTFSKYAANGLCGA